MLPFPPLGKVAGTAAVETAQGSDCSDSCPDHGMNDSTGRQDPESNFIQYMLLLAVGSFNCARVNTIEIDDTILYTVHPLDTI